MNILVTGGAGFIASNISDEFVKKRHKIIILDNLSSGRKANINPKSVFYKMDITDPAIEKIFKKHKIDAMCHHAAQIDIRVSVNDPIFDAKSNILGSINLLQNCIKYKVKKVIFASSGGAIYGEVKGSGAKETEKVDPLSPYGVAKESIERYIRYYSYTFGLEYTILRYGNVYGERQDPRGEAGVVAIFTGLMLNNKQPFIFGNGGQIRDYVYVGDVVRANLFALNKAKNQIINIGTGKGTSVNTLYDKLNRITGFNKKAKHKSQRKGELMRSILGISKAKAVLGWQPKVGIDEGFRRTVEYFREKK